MRLDAYQQMSEHEDRHWWFVGRRAVIDGLIDRIGLRPEARIAEIGCGSGGNLGLLSARGSVVGVEPFADALEIARRRYPNVRLLNGSLPRLIGLDGSTFDLVAMLDVLEHVEDDVTALRVCLGLLAPGGRLLITVPAHPALFGAHDRRLYHHRRYTREMLRQAISAAGGEVTYFSPFNTFLAPIAIAVRLLERAGVTIDNQERMPPRPVNWLLATLFAAERHVVGRFGLPFGLSYAVVVRFPEACRP